jgi:hypothetical protein
MKETLPLSKLLHAPTMDAETRDAYNAEYPNAKDITVRRMVYNIPDDVEIIDGERTVVSYISTREPDGHGTLFLPEGVIMDRYLRNGVVFDNHDSTKPIASPKSIVVDDYGLKAVTVFDRDNALANERWGEVQRRELKGWSVRFAARKLVERDARGWKTLTARLAAQWGVELSYFDTVSAIITEWELLEYSLTALPSNPGSVTTAVTKRSIDVKPDAPPADSLEGDTADEVTAECATPELDLPAVPGLPDVGTPQIDTLPDIDELPSVESLPVVAVLLPTVRGLPDIEVGEYIMSDEEVMAEAIARLRGMA